MLGTNREKTENLQSFAQLNSPWSSSGVHVLPLAVPMTDLAMGHGTYGTI